MTARDPYAPAAVWDDVGCGTGGDAVSLARHGLRVTAMDYSEAALTWARAKAAAAGVAVDFRQADMALPFPFGDEAFDAVMSNVAMHMFDDRTTPIVDLTHQRLRTGVGAVFKCVWRCVARKPAEA